VGFGLCNAEALFTRNKGPFYFNGYAFLTNLITAHNKDRLHVVSYNFDILFVCFEKTGGKFWSSARHPAPPRLTLPSPSRHPKASAWRCKRFSLHGPPDNNPFFPGPPRCLRGDRKAHVGHLSNLKRFSHPQLL
jgi:hypothetical protein